MRFKLKKDKQSELILKAKKNNTWNDFGNELNINSNYLRNDLCNEKILLKSDIFHKLCEIAHEDYSMYIEKVLENNWGMIKAESVLKDELKALLSRKNPNNLQN